MSPDQLLALLIAAIVPFIFLTDWMSRWPERRPVEPDLWE